MHIPLEKYQSYTSEEFIQDPMFRQWVLSPTPEAEKFWRGFQSQYPERQSVVVAARSLLLALHGSQKLPSDVQSKQLWARLLADTETSTNEIEENQPTRVLPLWKWLSVAAVVLIALGLGWLTFWRMDDPATYTEQVAQSKVPLVEKINHSQELQKIILSDGSQVVLYPGSQLSYSNPFAGDKREVYLSGKGFFEVTKDDTKPFIVFANQLVTKVVGTSFLIDAFENNTNPSVEVRTGKVKVFRLDKFKDSENGKPEEMILLTANQQVNFNVAKKDFATRYIAKPAILKVPEAHPDFYFENTAVADVFHTLEDAYGVELEFDQEVLKNCRITAPLGEEPLFRKLDIVCQTIGATYQVWGTRIVVQGKGCNL